MNTYFVAQYEIEGYGEIYEHKAETAEAAVLDHVESRGIDQIDLEYYTFRVYEPKVNVKTFEFDTTPRVVEVKTPKGDK